VKLLVEEGADMEAIDHEGDTARLYALQDRHMEVVNFFLDIDLASDRCKMESVLLSAVEDDDPELVTLLVNKGVNPNSSCKTGIGRDDCTILTWAAKKGYKDLVQQLIHYGADVNLQDNERWTALAQAAKYGHDSVVRLLMEHNSYIDFPNDYFTPLQFTPLQLAAANGRKSTVRILLQHGASVTHSSLAPDSLETRYHLGDYVLQQLSPGGGSPTDIRGSEGRAHLRRAVEISLMARV
ncbi:ankyrin repeat domain-containing protein, partial [Aspergillus neoniger CBS 115656]